MRCGCLMQAILATAGVLVLVIAGHGSLLAAEPVGWVQEVKGTVTILSNGKTSKAKIGDSLNVQDTVKTGAASRVQIMFKDKTTLALSENSEFRINEALLKKGSPPSLFVRLLRGTMGMLTGAISKLNPAGLKVESPMVALGIRGTEFAMAVDQSLEVHGLYTGGPVVVTANTKPAKAAAAPALQGKQKEDLCDQIAETIKRFELAYMSKRGAGAHSEAKQLDAKAKEYEKMLGKYGCN